MTDAPRPLATNERIARHVSALDDLTLGELQIVITEAMLRRGNGARWAAVVLRQLAIDMEYM